MKRIFFGVAFATLLFAGCGKEYDDTQLKERVDELEEQVQTNTNALNQLENKLEEATTVGLTATVTEVTGGHKITFSDGQSFIVMDGQDGAAGAQGPTGPAGSAGKDAAVSIAESADGTSWIITFNNREYAIKKGQFFAFILDVLEISLAPGQSMEIPYTLTNGDATTKVFVSAISGYTATVDQTEETVTITAPEELPASGFVVITAVKNSTGEESSQYISFSKGRLSVTSDAETVEAAGGTVTLTVSADCDYTVSIPEEATWLRQVETRAQVVTTYVYIQVDENTSEVARTATVKLLSAAGIHTVEIVQAGKPVDNFYITPENASEKLALIAAMTPAELDGKTVRFAAGEYTSGLTLNHSDASEMVTLTIAGEEGAEFATSGTAFELTNVKATLSGMSFKSGKQQVKVKGGETTIQQCAFSGVNNSSTNGGSIFMDGEAKVTVKNCTFNGNKAKYGADIYMVDGNLLVEDCAFTGTNGVRGGACLAMSAQADVNGYANTDYSKSKAVVKGCTFTNIQTGTGLETNNMDNAPCGVIACVHGEITVDGCTFDGCEGKSGTIVSLNSRFAAWNFNEGNAFLKMNNCVIKNSTLHRLGLITSNTSSDKKNFVFINNTSFQNISSTTGDYGIIYHCGGNGGVLMMNNVTAYGSTLPKGNGFFVNTDGFALVSNSTFVTETNNGFFRNGWADGAIKVINTIGINTKEGATGSICGESGKPFTTDGHCIYGPANDKTSSFSDAIKDATLATLAGYAWNETTNLVEWNGPAADFSKLSSSDFQGHLAGFGPAWATFYSESSAGDAFYNWLVSINAVGKDARGNDRGASWWPGAYQN